MGEVYKNPVKKLIPSKMETGFQQFLYKYVGPHIPEGMTPNMMTTVSALGGLFSIVMTLFTNLSRWCWLGTIAGLAVHLVADDLDGYIARSRGLSSKAGAYYDLIVDILFSTFLIISMGLTPAAHMLPMALAAPLYGIINVTMMNYIIYFNEFQFPRLGPIEAHLSYTAIAICAMIFGGKEVITVAGHGATVVDILAFIAMIPMYYEMIRMIITLYKRLEASQK